MVITTNEAQRTIPYYCNLKLGTSNIQGQSIKNEKKLRKVNRKFERHKLDILLVQETCTTGDVKERKIWEKVFKTKNIFLTSFGGNSVGAGIVIREVANFRVQKDPNGRYVGVVGDHEEGNFPILCTYAPVPDIQIMIFIKDEIAPLKMC